MTTTAPRTFARLIPSATPTDEQAALVSTLLAAALTAARAAGASPARVRREHEVVNTVLRGKRAPETTVRMVYAAFEAAGVAASVMVVD